MTNIRSNICVSPIIKCLSWNIESINGTEGAKTDNEHFTRILKRNDIICLQETKGEVTLPGYSSYTNLRKNVKKPSGGVVTLINNQLKHAVSKVNSASSLSSDILVVKLKQNSISIAQDIYIINVYIRPHNSKLHHTSIKGSETFERLNQILEDLKGKGEILLCGDFNSRIQTSPDYIINDSTHHNIYDLPTDYTPDTQYPRNSRDKNHNAFKKLFLDTILYNQLTILNGRTLGDYVGDYTCIKWNGSSVVDYFAVSPGLKNKVCHLNVLEFTEFSDHKPLMLQITIQHRKNLLESIDKKSNRAPNRYKFPATSAITFVSEQHNEPIRKLAEQIEASSYTINHEGSVKFNADFTNLLYKISDLALEKTKPPKKTKNNYKPWFSMSCRIAKRSLNKSARIVSKFPNSEYLRKKYYSVKKSYKKLIKLNKRSYFRKLNKNIEDGNILDWKYFKTLKRQKQSSNIEFDAFDLENFATFFKQLYADTHETIDSNKKRELLIEADRINLQKSRTPSDVNEPDNYNELDESITLEEINIYIKNLKNGKASSTDLINNEILKNVTPRIKNVMLSLFNHCFESGTYPWNSSIVTPLHKKGDIHDPDNYRAIAVGSCVGKLYSTILLNRFQNFRNINCPDPINQLGFTKNAQTADHLFTLSTIAKKYRSKKRPVYAVFVDFRKAFDSICRQALFYKLASAGLTGKFYNALRYMYANSKAQIKLSGYLSREIDIKKGTEQGHPLSPDLFKLFFKDLSPILEFQNCPILIDKIVSHLLWADDLVILALDPVTLQSQLNTLNDYCKNWGVDINMDKTKLLIFNGTKSATKQHRSHIESLCINGAKLQRVESYCYLGIDISSTGSFNLALKNLKIKATRALITLKRTIDRSSISFKACQTLFDALIKPIITYAAPIWVTSLKISNILARPHNWLEFSASNNKNMTKSFSVDSVEKVHLRFLKWALGVHRKAPNIGAWGGVRKIPPFL